MKARNHRGLIRQACVVLVGGAAFVGTIGGYTAQATEGGASFYVPGLRGPMAGFVPPPGFYFENDFYAYSGRLSSSKQTQVGGAVLAHVQVDARIDFITPTWVTPFKLFGGDLAFAMTLPIGVPRVSAGALVAAPRFGRLFNLGLSDATFNIGDPVVSSFVGWHAGNFHWQVGGSVSIPAGAYQPGQLSNVALNRPVGDLYAAATWLDPKIGLDISGAMGFEINGMNKATQYRSGNAIHFDLAATQHFSKEFAVGALFSHYQQISGDSGAGASVGSYKGRVTAIGGSMAYSFAIGKTPITATLKVLREVHVENRTRGTIGLLSIGFPLPQATTAVASTRTP